MPIIIKKQGAVAVSSTLSSATVRQKPEEKPVVQSSPKVEQQDLSRNFVIERKQTNGVASQDTALVVNGKQKSIGRKSHYLLDMLTLDDE
jgi:hypothetical protein